jgi:hypothetical protein
MNIYGWVFIIVSWALIIGLAIFCFVKVFSRRQIK